MISMLTSDIRTSYLDFFADRGHRVVHSSPLIPHDDPSVLFTVAGMVQFKDALLGREKLDYTKAVSCQKCVRAGGKHNDLENVGFTARHLTFFEMLGNFSFGDYFKEEAITWAWEYVQDVIELERDRLWVTVHPSDDEAREIWVKKLGIRPDRVIDHEENFWTMGDTGPCGPCSEIFYDQGEHIAGGPPGSPDEDGDRFLEFWNLVFPQFDRAPDGELTPLAQPGVDTGLGLERVATLKQRVQSNYEIDLFDPIFRKMLEFTSSKSVDEIRNEPSFRVIADHIRSSAFLVADGILPSREGRGYVLRRIIRRAIRHGYKQDLPNQFFHQLVAPLLDTLGEAYPELSSASVQIERALLTEENQFSETLQNGMRLLESALADTTSGKLAGDVVFKLYDTYGFPVDLTEDICQEHNVSIDSAGFEERMEQQRQQSRASEQFQEKSLTISLGDHETEFEGYSRLSDAAHVIGIYEQSDDKLVEVDNLGEGEKGIVLLDRTSFYGEAGGQVGDVGEITSNGTTFAVEDTQLNNKQILHYGRVTAGTLKSGQEIRFKVDALKRQDTARNHSATHLLHAALKTVLGTHVQQRGSLVAPDRLRFDFSHDLPLTDDEVSEIEALVNEKISINAKVLIRVMPYDEAIESGAVALFGEKYGDEVRVLEMCDGFSVELCGGTHVASTGEIGLFRVTSHGGIAAGIRRIEAVTGRQANLWSKQNEEILSTVYQRLQTNRDELVSRIDSLLQERQHLEDQLTSSAQQSAHDQASSLVETVEQVGVVKLVHGIVDGDPKTMMSVYDAVRSQLNSGVVVLGVVHNEKVNLVCGISKDLVGQYKANELINHVGSFVGAKGGGKPDLSRAGGGADTAALPLALQESRNWIETQSQVLS